MSQVVDFFGLGGFDEKHKNLYCLNVNGDLLVFNVGAKRVAKPTLGVTEVIADFSYLVQHKSAVKGVFLTSAVDGCAGGLHYLLRELSEVPVYVSTTSGRFLKRKYKSANIFLRNLQFNYVWPRKIISLGGLRIEVFKTNSAFPDSLGYAVFTAAGTVIFMGTNVFDYNKVNSHAVEINHLSQIAKAQKVLLLVTDAPYAHYDGYAVPKYQISHFLTHINFATFRRVIFFCVEDDLYKIDECIRYLKINFSAPLRIKVVGVNLLNIIEIQQSNNDKYQNIKFVNDGAANITFVAGSLQFLYAKMMEMGIADHLDDQEFTTQDLMLVALPLVFGQELNYAWALDQLARTNACVYTLPTNQLHQMKPHHEDIKLLIGLFRPQFFVPTNGLYKELLATCQTATATGLKASYCLSLKNGMLLKIRANNFFKEAKAIPTGDVFVTTGSGVKTSPIVVAERQQLGVNGAVIISLVVNQTKDLVTDAQITHRGVIVGTVNERWTQQVKTICREVAEKYKKQFMQTKNYPIKEIRSDINRLVSKIIRNQLFKRPIILTVIEELVSR